MEHLRLYLAPLRLTASSTGNFIGTNKLKEQLLPSPSAAQITPSILKLPTACRYRLRPQLRYPADKVAEFTVTDPGDISKTYEMIDGVGRSKAASLNKINQNQPSSMKPPGKEGGTERAA